MQSDLEYVLSLERDPENLPYITPWERIQHEAAIRFPDFRHFIIEARPDLERSASALPCELPPCMAAMGRGRPCLAGVQRPAWDGDGLLTWQARTHRGRQVGGFDPVEDAVC